MKVWVMMGETESGDKIGPAVYDYPVTRQEIKEELQRDYPEEYEDGLSISFDIWEEEVNTR